VGGGAPSSSRCLLLSVSGFCKRANEIEAAVTVSWAATFATVRAARTTMADARSDRPVARAASHEAVFYCTLYSAIGCAVNYGLDKVTDAPAHAILAGSPVYLYWVGLFCQDLLYPAIILKAWHATTKGSFDLGWCYLGREGNLFSKEWGEGKRSLTPGRLWWERQFFYALIGYLVKDCLEDMSTLLYVHHVACVVGTYTFMTGQNGVPMAFGTFLLEVGSSAYSSYVMWPCSALAVWYILAHTLSNLFAAYVLITCFMPANKHSWIWYYHVLAGPALLFMRQKTATLDVYAHFFGQAPA